MGCVHRFPSQLRCCLKDTAPKICYVFKAPWWQNQKRPQKNPSQFANVTKCRENWGPRRWRVQTGCPYCRWENLDNSQLVWKKFNIILLSWRVIYTKTCSSTPVNVSRKHMCHETTYCNIVQKARQSPDVLQHLAGWMVVYSYYRKLDSRRNEWTTATHSNTNESLITEY